MQKKLLITTGILGAFAVILGAFGAHALAERLNSSQLQTYQTGIQYHYYHTIALLGIVIFMGQQKNVKWLEKSAISFIIGIFFFSGSLYLLACKKLLFLENWTKFIGPITPIGGIFFIFGWVFLVIHAFKNIENQPH